MATGVRTGFTSYLSPWRKHSAQKLAKSNMHQISSSVDHRSQGEDRLGRSLFEEGFCTLCKSPFTLKKGRKKHRGSNQGEKEMHSIFVKKRKGRPGRGHTKRCISDSQERWTFGFCMEVAPNFQSH